MLPRSLRKQLYYYSSPFGGLKEVEETLSQDQLVDLTLHNDPILIVDPTMAAFSDPNEEGIDLTGYGFNPGSSFSVYNDRNEFLYKRFSEGNFGNHSFDKTTLQETDHVHYLQLIFYNSVPFRILLWVVRKPPISQIKKVISKSKLERDRSVIRSGTELLIILGRSVQLNGSPIDFYYLEGSEGNISLSNLIQTAQEKSQHLQYQPNDAIYMRPMSSLWSYLEQDGVPLVPTDDTSHYVGIDPNQVNVTPESFMVINFRRRQPQKIMANKSIKPSSPGISSKNSLNSASIVLERG